VARAGRNSCLDRDRQVKALTRRNIAVEALRDLVVAAEAEPPE
jgi:hypothetical protein